MNLNKKPISVAPTPIIMPPKYATSYTYNITDFDAFSKISFHCNLYDADGQIIDSRPVEITGSEYANWGTDDTYLINTISSKLGLSVHPPIKKPVTNCPINGFDSSGNVVKFCNLVIDSSSNIVLPDGYGRDTNNFIIDSTGKECKFKLLRYDSDANPIVFQSLAIDQRNNPLLPSGFLVDINGSVRDTTGAHIVIVT